MPPTSTIIQKIKDLLNKKKREYLRLAKIGRPVEYTLPTGLSFQLYPEGQIAEFLYTMDFEHDLLTIVDRYLRPKMNVVDVGANIGLYSVIAAQKIGPHGRVWAFEPAQDSVKRLKANLAANGIRTVTTERIGLTDRDDITLTIFNEEGHGDGYRFTSRKQEALQPAQVKKQGRVKAMTLDTYLAGVGSPKIDLLKVDVEGSELEVLKGARQTLIRQKNILVVFESAPIGLKRAGHSQTELHSFMKSLGFTLQAWDSKMQKWRTDKNGLLTIGNVWATRNRTSLHR